MNRPLLMSVPGGSDGRVVDPQDALRSAWALMASAVDEAAPRALAVNGLTETDAAELRKAVLLMRRLADRPALQAARDAS